MPLTVATMMSPPFAKRDTKLADGQIKMWRKLNARALKKARKEVAVLIPEDSCASLRVAGVTFLIPEDSRASFASCWCDLLDP